MNFLYVIKYNLQNKIVYLINNNFFKILKKLMKILISDAKNNIETIEIHENEKISDLKEKIKIKKGINHDDIYLHFGGEILENEKTVGDYEIEENNQIIYAGTFRGGNYKKCSFYKFILKKYIKYYKNINH